MSNNTIHYIHIQIPIRAETQEQAMVVAKLYAEKIDLPNIKVVPKPTVYLCDYDSGDLAISSEPLDTPAFDSNHICLREVRGGKITGYSTVRQILVNVLSAAGVQIRE